MNNKHKNKIKISNKGIRTHLIVNGTDVSKYVTSFELKQLAGERPKLTIEIQPINNLTILNLKNLDEIKVIKGSDSNE